MQSGLSMMKAAKEGLSEARWVEEEPISLAITVLTSMSEEDLRSTGVTRKVKDQVISLANQAKEAGLSGVVTSPQEAAMLREVLGQMLTLLLRCKACRRGTRRSNTCGNS